MERDEVFYQVSLDLSPENTRVFYTIMKRALDTWPGGEPIEQAMLEYLTHNAYKCMLEATLDGDSADR